MVCLVKIVWFLRDSEETSVDIFNAKTAITLGLIPGDFKKSFLKIAIVS